jgi:hypothetical protein
LAKAQCVIITHSLLKTSRVQDIGGFIHVIDKFSMRKFRQRITYGHTLTVMKSIYERQSVAVALLSCFSSFFSAVLFILVVLQKGKV